MSHSTNNPATDSISPTGGLNVDANSYTATQNIDNAPDILIAATRHTEISSSPLPSPEILKGYAELIPDCPERFMKMVEKEQENRHDNDKSKRVCSQSEISLIRRGQTMAFMLCIIFIGVGVTMGYLGFNAVCYILLAMGMTPVIGLFYNASQNKKKKD